MTQTDGIIELITENKAFDIYNLHGKLVRKNAKDLNGLPRGVYIIKGKKITLK